MMYFDWDRYVFAVLSTGNAWWLRAGVRVIGVVGVSWIWVSVRKVMHKWIGKNNKKEIA